MLLTQWKMKQYQWRFPFFFFSTCLVSFKNVNDIFHFIPFNSSCYSSLSANFALIVLGTISMKKKWMHHSQFYLRKHRNEGAKNKEGAVLHTLSSSWTDMSFHEMFANLLLYPNQSLVDKIFYIIQRTGFFLFFTL